MSLLLLYGGTFDPVHAGHLALARAARDALRCEVVWLPSADPPHRVRPGASAEQRAQMVELALQGEPGMRVDRREAARSTPSWSVVTLRELRREIGDDVPVAWLIGADSFRGLPTWHDWRALFGLCHFVVARRPGHELEDLPPELALACDGRWVQAAEALATGPSGNLLVLDLPLHPASASELRRRLAAGQPAGDWLHPDVAAFIRGHGLYRPAPGAGV